MLMGIALVYCLDSSAPPNGRLGTIPVILI